MEGHNTDTGKLHPDHLMSLWVPEDKTCGIYSGGYWSGYYETGPENPGAVTLLQQDGTYKMKNEYWQHWSKGNIDFPVLDSQGEILSVYGLEKIPCASASGLTMDEYGYLVSPPAVFPEAPDPAQGDIEKQAAFHDEL